jgi:5-methylcytosine-specific restriction protein A
VAKRNDKGQFIKGTHWRKPKPFWDKTWLENEYITKQRSAASIAAEFSIGESGILYWLQKLGIPTRTMAETRAIKHWGLSGAANGMYGKTGKANPRWNGGHSPERQCAYAKSVWKELAKTILKRDGYKCQKCGKPHNAEHKLQVHHIKPWSKYPELRFEESNLTTLCAKCHKNEHKRS